MRNSGQPQFKTNTKFPKKRTEKVELGSGMNEYIICPDCFCVYFHKSWHHALEEDKHLKENKKMKFALCPADKMIKNKQFEGQIILEGIPLELKSEIFNLIENMGERAFRKDPMDRVISIKDTKNAVEVSTTENQLAVRIAKKIKETFKKHAANIEIKHSHIEDPVRVVWKFKSP